MGLFGRGKTNKTAPPAAPPAHSQALIDLASRYLGPALLHQRAFGDLILSEPRWWADFGEGTISFGEQVYTIQFLGSESEVSNTWLWGTENINNYPDQVLQGVRAFHGALRQHGTIPDLVESMLPLDELINGHVIASIAAASSSGDWCYYRCPYDGGAAFVLVGDLPEFVFAPVAPKPVADALTHLIQTYPLNHRLLAQSLLTTNCVAQETAPDGALLGTFEDGSIMRVGFDDAGRVAAINFELRP
ncbi:MAG: hypothetical protein LBR27_09240 [Bifidobacteriaceae bacterium]|jgi:hypothetical protein|nr:hypothetical protein [Bifidobacteriaceae bacterium]